MCPQNDFVRVVRVCSVIIIMELYDMENSQLILLELTNKIGGGAWSLMVLL